MVLHSIPKVTIAIPTLNRACYLRVAVESALSQTYGNIEVIVSNNASSDATSTYLDSLIAPRLIVLNQTVLLSMTDNWNVCLTAATGEYFLLLSDDDLLEPDAINELIGGYAKLDGYPVPGLVYCGGCVIDSAGDVTRLLKPSPPREAARDLITAFFEGERDLRFCGVLLRTADLLDKFPATYKVACDAAVWMKIAMRHGTAVYIPKSLIRYRLHPNLSSATHLDVWRSEYRQLLELVLREDERAVCPDPRFAMHLRSVIRRVDRNMIIGRINQSFRNNKVKALLEYGRRLSAFLSPVGLVLLAKGIISLFLNDRTRIWLKKILRKQPAFE